jgi:diketogulonate reductase-like aldo/keto reductase
MKTNDYLLHRRDLMQLGGLSALAWAVGPSRLCATRQVMQTRAVPKTGEQLALVGMGTSRTFDVRANAQNIEQLTEVLQIFFAKGGQLIDSSPMYGNAESMLGKTLPAVTGKERLFTATKVWTDGEQAGIAQMKQSAERIGVKTIDLMQIHNLRDWQTHLKTLRKSKEQGQIRYIGVTTSHGRFHDELVKLLRTEPFDFVQFSYNIVNRDVEATLLPLAQDKGVATLINRPFEGGDLFRAVKGKSLPKWAAEIGCKTWAQFFLKFAAGHRAVTCLIPATSKPEHMADNMQAGYGPMPDQKTRERMAEHILSL